MKIYKTLLVFMLLFFGAAHSQGTDLELANRYFERTYYSKAIPLFEKIVKKNTSPEVMRKLADSYYFVNNYEQALEWYTRLVPFASASADDIYYFRYVHALKASGKPTDAEALLRKLNTENPTALALLDASIEQLEDISAIGARFDISSLPVNTPDSEFAPWKYGDTLLYTAVRTKGKTYQWNDEHYLDIYAVPTDRLKAGDSTGIPFAREVNSKLHEGNAIVTKDGRTMYFTRNYSKEGKRLRNSAKVSPLQLFRAEWQEGKWTNITSLPFNSSEFSTEHPALSADEQTLYFSSDMPGSYGSFDIYAVAVNGGAFGTPVNLGPEINTPYKEQFPFVAKDNKLYFSSDGHYGYGAMDVFVSDIKEGSYSKPLNVGLPVNSGYDDFSFSIDSHTKAGYFASNRLSGKGSDDIYEILELKPLIIESCKQSIEGVVTDVDTRVPIDSALVVLRDSEHQELQRVITGPDGRFQFAAGCVRSYTVTAEKISYSSAERKLKLLKERNKVNDASMALKSDTIAAQQLAVEEGQKKQKDEEEKKKRIADLLAKEKDVVKDKERLIIKTEPIYFDYDLWYIRKESKPILDRVIQLMNKYPHMVVEIGSHTDVRGNNEYNRVLSAKRAASTRDYFIDKGIPEARIFSKGYGESVPIIRCVPDDSCNEEQHELNRRSEFVITDL